MSQSPASLRQIAEASGVSVSTVSRVLLDRQNVSPKTRQRVVDVARRFKYRPNLLVRGMQTGQTGTIGVLLYPGESFAAQMLVGIHDALAASDRAPLLLWTDRGDDAGDRPSELAQIHRMLDRRVDGIILSPIVDAASDDYLKEVWDRGIPLVAVDRELPHTHADFIGCDDRMLGRIAADALVDAGHTRLGHIAGPDFTSTGRHRRAGFVDRAVERLSTPPRVVVEPSFAHGKAAALQLLDGPDRCTAVFAANDRLATGVYEAADQLGLSIPDDVSVIGAGAFDFGRWLRPRLATIDQRPREIGKEAVRVLLGRLASDEQSADAIRLRLEPRLVPGDSIRPVGRA